MREIIDRVQINMPFQLLAERYLPIILEKKINPEIGFNCFVLDRFKKDEFKDIADRITDAGLTVTMHAPFFDLRPGAVDPKLRAASIERLKQFFDLAPLFRPRSMVCHAAFEEKYYINIEKDWLTNSVDTWSHFIDIAADLDSIIALENVYEESPLYPALLLDAFSDVQQIGYCFDTGHCNTFSSAPMEEWIDKIGLRIKEVHLHDNDGSSDAHDAIGDGTFPFHDFLNILSERGIRPIITLEPHTEKTLWRTLEKIKEMKLLKYLDD
ncbi:MAG: sugar phosphate isomerase/epimerase [Deltaproteobacteria bacterium]|nr:sugar phosphate isomerase/epimerase [Deltaproteobacteria bacterium]